MKSKFLFVAKFMAMVIIINFLCGCEAWDATVNWFMGTPPTAANPGGTQGHGAGLMAILGGLLGGPIGYAVTGVGAAVGPLYKWFKHDKSGDGLILATQKARGALPEDAREVFDNTMRDMMDHTIKGDLRSYVREKKEKLRKNGKMIQERFSKKHFFKGAALKTMSEVLNPPVKPKGNDI